MDYLLTSNGLFELLAVNNIIVRQIQMKLLVVL